jgi:hypothetical protein
MGVNMSKKASESKIPRSFITQRRYNFLCDKKILAAAFLFIIIIIALLSITNIKTEKQKTEIYAGGVNLTYLDDTEISEDVYTVNICGPKDCGVILINNTGEKTDEFRFVAEGVPDGWSITFEHDMMHVDTEGIIWNTIYYEASSSKGSYFVNITATSVNNPNVKDIITLRLDVTNTDGVTTKKGDQVIVQYILWDTNGNELDSGTLPATAGEPGAGPAGQVTYIDGFYLGLLGMEKERFSEGETKKIRVPPELAYGTDPDAHELGGETLIFQLTIMASSGSW